MLRAQLDADERKKARLLQDKAHCFDSMSYFVFFVAYFCQLVRSTEGRISNIGRRPLVTSCFDCVSTRRRQRHRLEQLAGQARTAVHTARMTAIFENKSLAYTFGEPGYIIKLKSCRQELAPAAERGAKE